MNPLRNSSFPRLWLVPVVFKVDETAHVLIALFLAMGCFVAEFSF